MPKQSRDTLLGPNAGRKRAERKKRRMAAEKNGGAANPPPQNQLQGEATNPLKYFQLKALISIPKVQPRFAIAISKKYPTMRSLLNVYMDPNKSVHEKEYLLKDLPTEGLIGEDRRLGEICSKRIYRVIMAQCGTILTDDVEDGADFFTHQTTS